MESGSQTHAAGENPFADQLDPWCATRLRLDGMHDSRIQNFSTVDTVTASCDGVSVKQSAPNLLSTPHPDYLGSAIARVAARLTSTHTDATSRLRRGDSDTNSKAHKQKSRVSGSSTVSTSRLSVRRAVSTDTHAAVLAEARRILSSVAIIKRGSSRIGGAPRAAAALKRRHDTEAQIKPQSSSSSSRPRGKRPQYRDDDDHDDVKDVIALPSEDETNWDDADDDIDSKQITSDSDSAVSEESSPATRRVPATAGAGYAAKRIKRRHTEGRESSSTGLKRTSAMQSSGDTATVGPAAGTAALSDRFSSIRGTAGTSSSKKTGKNAAIKQRVVRAASHSAVAGDIDGPGDSTAFEEVRQKKRWAAATGEAIASSSKGATAEAAAAVSSLLSSILSRGGASMERFAREYPGRSSSGSMRRSGAAAAAAATAATAPAPFGNSSAASTLDSCAGAQQQTASATESRNAVSASVVRVCRDKLLLLGLHACLELGSNSSDSHDDDARILPIASSAASSSSSRPSSLTEASSLTASSSCRRFIETVAPAIVRECVASCGGSIDAVSDIIADLQRAGLLEEVQMRDDDESMMDCTSAPPLKTDAASSSSSSGGGGVLATAPSSSSSRRIAALALGIRASRNCLSGITQPLVGISALGLASLPREMAVLWTASSSSSSSSLASSSSSVAASSAPVVYDSVIPIDVRKANGSTVIGASELAVLAASLLVPPPHAPAVSSARTATPAVSLHVELSQTDQVATDAWFRESEAWHASRSGSASKSGRAPVMLKRSTDGSIALSALVGGLATIRAEALQRERNSAMVPASDDSSEVPSSAAASETSSTSSGAAAPVSAAAPASSSASAPAGSGAPSSECETMPRDARLTLRLTTTAPAGMLQRGPTLSARSAVRTSGSSVLRHVVRHMARSLLGELSSAPSRPPSSAATEGSATESLQLPPPPTEVDVTEGALPLRHVLMSALESAGPCGLTLDALTALLSGPQSSIPWSGWLAQALSTLLQPVPPSTSATVETEASTLFTLLPTSAGAALAAMPMHQTSSSSSVAEAATAPASVTVAASGGHDRVPLYLRQLVLRTALSAASSSTSLGFFSAQVEVGALAGAATAPASSTLVAENADMQQQQLCGSDDVILVRGREATVCVLRRHASLLSLPADYSENNDLAADFSDSGHVGGDGPSSAGLLGSHHRQLLCAWSAFSHSSAAAAAAAAVVSPTPVPSSAHAGGPPHSVEQYQQHTTLLSRISRVVAAVVSTDPGITEDSLVAALSGESGLWPWLSPLDLRSTLRYLVAAGVLCARVSLRSCVPPAPSAFSPLPTGRGERDRRAAAELDAVGCKELSRRGVGLLDVVDVWTDALPLLQLSSSDVVDDSPRVPLIYDVYGDPVPIGNEGIVTRFTPVGMPNIAVESLKLLSI